MKNKTSIVLVLALLAIVLTGCAAGTNEVLHMPNPHGFVAGFWLGLWHGVIAMITFIISLFNENVRIYEVHNSGGWYDLGFIMGSGIFGTALSRAVSLGL